MKRIIWIFVVLIIVLFSSCTDKKTPDFSESSDRHNQTQSEDNPANLPESEQESEHSGSAVLNDQNNPTFLYEKLDFPEELVQADHLYSCYRDANAECLLLSVCSENESVSNLSNKTECFALCDTNGNITTYEISTDAYITSAVPYQDGVAYVDYEVQSDSSAKWSIIHTDGVKEKTIDSGSADYYRETPCLFLVNDEMYYLWGNGEGFGVKQFKDGTVKSVFERNDCSLASVEAHSNGNQYCFLAKYPDETFSTFFICDSNGVRQEYKLHGKITSFSICDRYAVCGTGNEENSKCCIEAVELSTGEAKTVSTYGPPWCLAGCGSAVVCVNNNWQPYYFNVYEEHITSMPLPSASNGTPIYLYASGESQFFALTLKNSEYSLYHLSISL